jgi:hypothetical protein
MARSTPALARALDTLGKKIPQFAAKRPGLTSAAVGTGAAALSRAPEAEKLEKSMTAAKYSSCPVMEKFAEHHVTLAARAEFAKHAEGAEWGSPSPSGGRQETPSPFVQGIGTQAAKESVSGLRRMVGHAFQAIKDVFFDEPKREKLLENIVHEDQVVRTFDRENPGQAAAAFKTMSRFAPTLSTDPNVATAFLRNAAMSGGALDHQMVRGLAEAETQVQRAKNEGAYLKGGF